MGSTPPGCTWTGIVVTTSEKRIEQTDGARPD